MRTSTTTKFDYPSITPLPYSISSPSTLHPKLLSNKIKYLQYNKQQRQKQRLHAKNRKQKKLQLQIKSNKKKISSELQKKKLQLTQLYHLENLIQKQQIFSHQKAIQRQQVQQNIKIQLAKKIAQNDQNAKNRFIQALKRLQKQKQLNNNKQKQAHHRRKIIQQTQQKQRSKAIKYRQQHTQKQLQQKQYNKQSLFKTTSNKTIDYTKSYLHNPNIIISQQQQHQQNAMDKANKYNDKQKQKSLQQQTKYQQNKKISQQRGRKALQKLALQKQYKQYLTSQQQKAKLYNLSRVQAGKKNQYTYPIPLFSGLKPSTLHQIQTNKKLKIQSQFEKLFFSSSNPSWFNIPSTRYHIQQNKLIYDQDNCNQFTNNKFENSRNCGIAISDSYCSFKSLEVDEVPQIEHKDKQDKVIEKEQRKAFQPQLNSAPHNQYNETAQQKRQQLSYSYSQDEQC